MRLDQALFVPRVISYAPSWFCTAGCSHCFLSHEARKQDNYSDLVLNALLADLPSAIRVVAINGGEPLERAARTWWILEKIHSKSRLTSLVTNGSWAQDQSRVRRFLEDSYSLGLRGLAISYDDYHHVSIPERCLIDLVENAAALGISVRIKGVGKSFSRRMQILAGKCDILKNAKGMENYNLQRVGNARRRKADIVFSGAVDHCLGLREPWLTPGGDVFACCSPAALSEKNSPLYLGNVLKAPLSGLMENASRDLFRAALVAFGAIELCQVLGVATHGATGDTQCERCLSILSNDRIVREIRAELDRSPSVKKEVVARVILLESLGHLDLGPEFREPESSLE